MRDNAPYNKPDRAFALINLLLSVPLILLLGGCGGMSEPSALTVRDADKKGNSIRMTKLDARVEFTGSVAETTLTITFENRSDQVMEAQLDLPLPEGASVSRYALEVNGKMREGVIVDKQQGRVAYENTIRAGIDPGLLEKTTGNRFRTRIYPVPAKGTKRVLVSYTEPLSMQAGAMSYHLPVSTKHRLKNFSLTMHSTGESPITSPQWGRGEARNEWSFQRSNYQPRDMQFHLTPNRNTTELVMQRGRDGKSYFLVSDFHGDLRSEARPAPKKIMLVWDASHSGGGRSIKRELKVLEHYFRQYPNTQVRLHLLRNQLGDAGHFSVNGGDWSRLRSYLQSVIYDGATRMSSLRLTDRGYDTILFFGDGLGTLGNKSVRVGKTPVFAINSSHHADHTMLASIAHQSGGEYVNLRRVSDSNAALALTHRRAKLLRVSGTGISSVHSTSSIGHALAVGRAASSVSTLRLHYLSASGKPFTRTVKLSRSRHFHRGKAAAKLWAQGEVERLSLSKDRNRAAIVRLAKTHHLVTDFTSLIVLDRIVDYVRYRIVPPDAAMRKQYYQLIKNSPAHRPHKRADLNKIYKKWKEITSWHRTKFPLPMKVAKPRLRPPSSPSFLGGGAAEAPALESPAPDPADFTNPVRFHSIPGVPSGPSRVSNIATARLRSGDFAITRNSIDAILNNPVRSKGASIQRGIQLKSSKPNTVYTRAIERAAKAGKSIWPTYAAQKKKYGQVTGFYLDVADVLSRLGKQAEARRVLTNLAEISPENIEMTRVLAHKLSQIGEFAMAESLMREVLKLREEEPQSHRDLALVLIQRKRYQEAADLLWEVVSREWSDSQWGSRFDGIQMVALNEWNHLHHRHGSRIRLRASQKRFIYRLDTDIRVVIDWDTDDSDMDLWVTDPTGEKCYYARNLTRLGGRISRDMTQGRGPEEFLIRRAKHGQYKIQINYYGTREQNHIGATTLHATIITNWGRSNEKRRRVTLRLGQAKGVVDVGDVQF